MNEKAIVIYGSKYGSTKKYAEWISEKLNCNCLDFKNISSVDISKYDSVIYGGGLYASSILGLKKLKNYEIKNLTLFTVGLATPETTDYSSIIYSNTKNLRVKNLKTFHLKGCINYNDLGLIDRIMMAMLKKFSIDKKKKSDLTEDDILMLNTYGKSVNFMDIDTIQPILDYVNSL